ncbi:hypothetical protein VTK56DRAFT_8147 [Thermocarpiscus australiensis]
MRIPTLSHITGPYNLGPVPCGSGPTYGGIDSLSVLSLHVARERHISIARPASLLPSSPYIKAQPHPTAAYNRLAPSPAAYLEFHSASLSRSPTAPLTQTPYLSTAITATATLTRPRVLRNTLLSSLSIARNMSTASRHSSLSRSPSFSHLPIGSSVPELSPVPFLFIPISFCPVYSLPLVSTFPLIVRIYIPFPTRS